MSYPYTKLYGDAPVYVTATATGAVDGSTTQVIGISLGLPVVEQLADIAVRFKIPRTSHLDSNGQPAQRLMFNGSELVSGLTFAQQGVNKDAVLVLADSA